MELTEEPKVKFDDLQFAIENERGEAMTIAFFLTGVVDRNEDAKLSALRSSIEHQYSETAITVLRADN